MNGGRMLVFLDANVLFSASWSLDNDFLRLWQMEEAELLSSPYVVEEARRNMARPQQLQHFEKLLLRGILYPTGRICHCLLE